MDKKRSEKKFFWIILIAAAVIVSITAVSLAVWTGYNTSRIGGTDVDVPNTTARYLIAQVSDADEARFGYVAYDDAAGAFRYSQTYAQRYGDALSPADFEALTGDLRAVVVGYVGYLGELEPLLIPASLPVSVGGTKKSATVTAVEMQTPEEFPALDLITAVSIADGIGEIRGVSFSYLKNLCTVTFEGRRPTIGENCFRGCPKLVTPV